MSELIPFVNLDTMDSSLRILSKQLCSNLNNNGDSKYLWSGIFYQVFILEVHCKVLENCSRKLQTHIYQDTQALLSLLKIFKLLLNTFIKVMTLLEDLMEL